MNTGRKVNLKFNVPWTLPVLIYVITVFTGPNYAHASNFDNTLTPLQQSPSPTGMRARDTIPRSKADTGASQQADTVQLHVSKDSLDTPISYAASDSMVLDVPGKKIRLYNQANTKYKDLDLSAYKIELDQQKQVIVATYATDTAGKIAGRPKFVQGENNMDSDSITYDLKTKKGITTSTYTTQGEMFVYGERIKKYSETEYFALRGRFTTCNLDTPHFAFMTNKLKLINKKMAISGPIHPEFEGVPVPIYIPFGFFPLSQGRHSGMLPPQFTVNQQFGLGLEGVGYYKVLNDNFDVLTRADIYSYGGYRINLTPSYRVRYRYQGQLNFSYQNTRFLSDAGIKQYDNNKSFNIYWTHTVDSKARPGTSFSANVNAGSTKYNRFVANDPRINFQNQLASSITYSKNWDNKYNLTVSALHNQNNNTRLVTLNLPNIAFTATNFYPFQQKEFVGEPKWYEKLGIGLNSNVTGNASFYDSLFNFRKLVDTFQWGAQHNIPITLSLPALGPFQIAPGISYQERWYAQQFKRQWNGKKLDTVITKGFYAARDMSFNLSFNTAVFGTFAGFGKNSRVKAIRHVIRPSFGINYKPDMAKSDYYEIPLDSSNGTRTYRFSRFEGSTFGAFGEGRFGGISFGVDNNLEMKVRSKSDSAAESDRKIKLLDGFGFNGSYNLLADSQKLSILNFYLRSTLFDKINITAGAILDPYAIDAQGLRTNKYSWEGGKFTPGRLTNANIAISTSFRSKEDPDKKKPKDNSDDAGLPQTMEEQQAQLEYIRRNPSEFADFNIPWSVNLSYSLNFSRIFQVDNSTNGGNRFKTEITSNISVNGDFNLTPKWKVGMNSYYDFREFKISSLSMYLSREMHCWQMSINVTPVGLYRSFNITINPKSSLLRDIKVNRTRSFYGG